MSPSIERTKKVRLLLRRLIRDQIHIHLQTRSFILPCRVLLDAFFMGSLFYWQETPQPYWQEQELWLTEIMINILSLAFGEICKWVFFPGLLACIGSTLEKVFSKVKQISEWLLKLVAELGSEPAPPDLPVRLPLLLPPRTRGGWQLCTVPSVPQPCPRQGSSLRSLLQRTVQMLRTEALWALVQIRMLLWDI